MIKSALQWITDLRKPNLELIGNQTWSDKPMTRIEYNPKAKALRLTSLTSLVQYLLSGCDGTSGKKLIVHVISPWCIAVFSHMDDECERDEYLEVCAMTPEFKFDTFIGHEEFCIGLQSKFIDAGDRSLLLKFAGTVEAGSVSEYGDDGVTQKATVKTGIASKSDAIVPNPVRLSPYRTFLEIPQPESTFVFRMQQDKYGPVKCALFECDGGAWKMEAKESILRYLTSELEEIRDNILILS